MRSILITMLLFFAASTQAMPVVWTLADAVFDDGGIATGSFTYDAGTGTYTDINIVTTAGNQQPIPVYPGSNYGDLNNNTVPGSHILIFETGSNNYGLGLNWQGSLSNAGGNIALEVGMTSAGSYEIDLSNFSQRFLASGTISAIPVPAAVWLFGSALAGLGWFRRKTA
jgi:hypothetical protein